MQGVRGYGVEREIIWRDGVTVEGGDETQTVANLGMCPCCVRGLGGGVDTYVLATLNNG